MSELISKQTAIDAVMDEFKRIPTNAIRAKIRIEALPPVQPEPCEDAVSRTEILRMINCINDHHAITPYKSVGAITEHLTRIASNLPPVTPKQPEQHLDEWCADCKEYDHENRCCPRWTQVIRQTRRELQDEFVMTAVDGTLWVTVDDVQKVGRVIVDEGKSKFCKTFYGDGQVEQKWIPVSDKLPDEKGEYLVTYHPCYWDNVYDEIKVGFDTFRGKTKWAKKKYQRVIAWKPIDEPYKPIM